jgi:hypothetical protein
MNSDTEHFIESYSKNKLHAFYSTNLKTVGTETAINNNTEFPI